MSRGNKRGIDAAKLRDWRQAGIALAAARPVGCKDCGSGMAQP